MNIESDKRKLIQDDRLRMRHFAFEDLKLLRKEVLRRPVIPIPAMVEVCSNQEGDYPRRGRLLAMSSEDSRLHGRVEQTPRG